MYSPRTKVFKTKREKLIAEIVEALEINSFDVEVHRKNLLNQIEKRQLF